MSRFPFIILVGAIFIGGCGFFAFRYPKSFAKFNAPERYGMTWLSGPKYVAFTKIMAIVLMVAALVLIAAMIQSTFLYP